MLEWTKNVACDIYRAYWKWQGDDGSQVAASVSFYMAVSFFPLLLILISATGFVLRFSGWGRSARQLLLNLIAEQTSPSLTRELDAVLSNVEQNAAVGGPVGVVMLIVASMAVFVHFDNAMDRVWNVPRSPYAGIFAAVRNVLVDRVRAFLMLLGIGVFVVVGFAATMSLTAIGHFASNRLPLPQLVWTLATTTAAICLNWLLFMIIYKYLPKVPVRWSEAARGALFAAIMWELGRRLLAAIVIGSRFNVYGVVGAFVAIMLWTFYAVTILFLGAEYIQVFCARCSAKERPH